MAGVGEQLRGKVERNQERRALPGCRSTSGARPAASWATWRSDQTRTAARMVPRGGAVITRGRTGEKKEAHLKSRRPLKNLMDVAFP